MPVTPSAEKRLRQTGKRRLRNRGYSSRARTFIKRPGELARRGQWDEAEQFAHLAVSALDRAAQKGALHKKNAARRKSRLLKKLQRARSQSS